MAARWSQAGSLRKAMAKRFQPLIATISKVRISVAANHASVSQLKKLLASLLR